MKRIITGIAVIAIVSGAVAFKSARFTNPTVYCAASGSQTIATSCTLVNYVENSASGLEADPCPTKFVGTIAHIQDPLNPTKCKNSTATAFDQQQ